MILRLLLPIILNQKGSSLVVGDHHVLQIVAEFRGYWDDHIGCVHRFHLSFVTLIVILILVLVIDIDLLQLLPTCLLVVIGHNLALGHFGRRLLFTGVREVVRHYSRWIVVSTSFGHGDFYHL